MTSVLRFPQPLTAFERTLIERLALRDEAQDYAREQKEPSSAARRIRYEQAHAATE